MSETTTTETTSTAAAPKKSWIKTIIGSIAGMVSAAVMAVLSPLVTNVAKPPKPVANFATEHKGLDVTFHNRSTGGSKLCWDYGDGSALEFLPASQPDITHTYPKTGTYQVKLTVSNILGDQNDRLVPLDLSDAQVAATTVAGKPEIVDLYSRPPGGNVGKAIFAPATFQFEATADDAQTFAWDFNDQSGFQPGDSRISHTFTQPGEYHVKLCAINGKLSAEKEVTVFVQPPPTGALVVSLRVMDTGTPVDVRQRIETFSQAVVVQGKKGPATIERIIPATSGYEISRCVLKQAFNSNVAKVDCLVMPDHKSVKLVAHLTPVATPSEAVLNQKVLIEETQRRLPSAEAKPQLVGTLTAPGTTSLRMPATPENWLGLKRQITLELWQGNSLIWRGSDLPRGVPVNVGGVQYHMNSSLSGDKLQLQLTAN